VEGLPAPRPAGVGYHQLTIAHHDCCMSSSQCGASGHGQRHPATTRSRPVTPVAPPRRLSQLSRWTIADSRRSTLLPRSPLCFRPARRPVSHPSLSCKSSSPAIQTGRSSCRPKRAFDCVARFAFAGIHALGSLLHPLRIPPSPASALGDRWMLHAGCSPLSLRP
jgi:hypothetical protein